MKFSIVAEDQMIMGLEEECVIFLTVGHDKGFFLPHSDLNVAIALFVTGNLFRTKCIAYSHFSLYT